VKSTALEAYVHQDLPFEKLVEELQPNRDLSYNPLFQVMFVLQNVPKPNLNLTDVSVTYEESYNGTSKFDLTLFMEDSEQGLVATCEYNTNLFNADTITRMLGHLQTLLTSIVSDPQQRIADLQLLTSSEVQQLLVEWNDTKTDYPQDKCIQQLFEAQVEKTPNAVAVVFDNQELTYQELNDRANQLAHYLQELGVKPEVIVGVCMQRSLEMAIALLAILKAGGAYVPLDPAYPQERLTFMLEDSQAKVLLTQSSLVELFAKSKAFIVCIDNLQLPSQHRENPFSEVKPNNLAYVIYTSGSTGVPKGVAIAHESCVALLTWSREVFTDDELAGVLASTSICFDLSVFELFVPLSWGGKAIVVENALHLPSLAAEVSLINTVPSVIAELLQVNGLPASVKTVNLAGEPLQNQLVQQIYQNHHIQKVFNLYGPSEDTTYSTFTQIDKGDNKVTIGRPITNTQIYLLDTNLQPVPIGVPGEIYIGGAGLARGYLNRPELTKERFISNQFSNKIESRLYKTGDLARYLPDGNLEYLGRIDHQVKIRGFRIELGEIENALLKHPAVREVLVLAREDQQLVAYMVCLSDQIPTVNQLRTYLKELLPEYMVPSVFIFLETFPLLPNGKIDRRALPVAEALRPTLTTAYEVPQSEMEQQIAKLWQEVLHLDKVGIHDNFFDLGGHSLLMLQVNHQLRTILQQDISVVTMFQNPTIYSLAQYLSQTTENKLAFETVRDSPLERLRQRIQKQKTANNKTKQLLMKKSRNNSH
jgi:amino acid adenylation domain-containing protein